MKKANIAVGVIGILISAYVLYTASGFPANQSAVDPGAAYFPSLMGVFVIALCALLIVRSLMGKGVGLDEVFTITPGIKRAGLGVLLFVAYCFLFKPLGFVLDSILLSFLGMLLLQNRKYVQMAIVSVATSVVIYVIFANFLGAKLPAGVLSGIL